MKGKIIFAPSVNGTELLRLMARQGKNTIGCRVMNGIELAEFALMQAGVFSDAKYIRTNEAAALIYSFLGEIRHFSSASFSDAVNIASTLREVRMLIPDDESETMREQLSQGKFPDNSSSLFEVYERYMSELEKQGYIDDIQLIREAVKAGSALDAEFITLKEHPLSPLENKLINVVSGGNFNDVSLCGLLNITEKNSCYNDMTEAYGASNEVQNIISQICKSGCKLDECTIAVADTAMYSQLFYEMSQTYGIPMSFGCGLPITNSTPAVLLKNYLDWNTSGFNGKNALDKMIFSESFERKLLLEKLAVDNKQLKRIIEIAGDLRLSTDRNRNVEKLSNLKNVSDITDEERGLLKLLADEFEQGCSYFIKTYSHIRNAQSGKLDRSAVNVICNDLDAFSLVEDADACEIIPSILSKTICSENSREGCLHITGIGQSLESLRDNLYIVGLSADAFPGRPKENYLLTDDDLMLFSEESPTSENKIRRKVKVFEQLLKTASSLGNEVHLSYSGFDTAELKAVNPSSVLYEAFRVRNGEESTLDDMKENICHVGYFTSGFSASDKIAKAYASGKNVITAPKDIPDEMYEFKNEYTFSVSDIVNYLNCQRSFFYGSILGIKVKEEDDPLKVISAADKGTLFHALMDIKRKTKITKDELLEKAENMWNEYMIKRPPFNENTAEYLRKEFLEMTENGYLSDRGNEVIESEFDVKYLHESGITIIGKADRVEKNPDGKCIIADFKTGKSKGYIDNDFASCIQTLLYAYMLNKKGINIEECEYRFVKEEKVIKCAYSAVFEEKINELLYTIAESIKQNRFEYAENSNNCRYCNLKEICGREALE